MNLETSRQSFGDEGPLSLNVANVQVLIERMEQFPLSKLGNGEFAKKLQKETGWSTRETEQAIAEYKKFMVLTAVMPTEATPSENIDKVWHLHLQYSRNYRDEMCEKILGRVIDHEPGESAERGRFDRQYIETLAYYKALFGKDAPKSMWERGGLAESEIGRSYTALVQKKVPLRSHLDAQSSSAGDSGGAPMFLYYGDGGFGDRVEPVDPTAGMPASLPAANGVPSYESGFESSSFIAPADGGGGFFSGLASWFGFGGSDGASSSDAGGSSSSTGSGSSGGYSDGGGGHSSGGSDTGSSSASCGGGSSSCGGGGGGCGGGGCGGS